MDLNDNRAIPVTDEQVKVFGKWVKDNYDGKKHFESALRCKDRRFIEYMFVHTLFSEEQRNAWLKSEKDGKENRLQLYRRRLEIKISRTSAELIRRAFTEEEMSDEEQLVRHLKTLQKENYWQFQGRVPMHLIIEEVTAEQRAAYTPTICEMCLSKHELMHTCVTKCGHVFGIECYREWDYKTCPTCSEFCCEVTVFQM